MSTTPPPEEEEPVIIDQEKILDTCVSEVTNQSFQMRASIDKNKLRHSLKYAKNMLDTLKNPYISPSGYYQLYTSIFDEMQYLYNYFKEEARRGRRMKDLYDTVQQCENIIPRIFLLISVGSVYIETGQTTATEVIFDLLNIIKGVQNPLRGLFCRYFLLKMIKDKLPDKGNEFEKPGSTFEDTIKFIITNLDDMNRLWIRLSSGTTGSEKIEKERERNELRVLVGENITRLSSLNGMTLEIYQKQVLPKIIEFLLESKDQVSQEYLMECVIHAFPDEFNIQCMNTLLETCTKLEQGVDVKSLFIALMDKLAKFVENSKGESDVVASAEKIFDLLKNNIDKLVNDDTSGSMDNNKIIELEVAFTKFTIRCCPEKDKLNTINHILYSCVNLLGKNKNEKVNNEGIRLIEKLLTAALESPLSIFDMPNFPELMKYLDYPSRASLSLRIIDSLVKGTSKVIVNTSEKMSTLVDFVRPLLEDSPDSGEFDPIQFDYEQTSVCKILFITKCNDPSEMYEILSVLKNVFIKGGSKRMKYTLPALINAYISLAYGVSTAVAKQNGIPDSRTTPIHLDSVSQYSSLHSIDTNGLYVKFLNRIYTQINDTMTLISVDYPEIAFKLYLTVACQVNDISVERGTFEEVCYSSITAAIGIFKEGKIKDDVKVHLIGMLVGTVLTFTILGRDNWIAIASNIQSAAQTLLKRGDQCVAILNCSHLYFNDIVMDKMKIADCLTKAKRFADFAMTNPQNAILFIHILNKYIFFIEKCDKEDFLDFIRIDSVNDLLELIKNHIESMKIENKDAKYLPEIEEYYNNTIAVIKARRTNKKILEQFTI